MHRATETDFIVRMQRTEEGPPCCSVSVCRCAPPLLAQLHSSRPKKQSGQKTNSYLPYAAIAVPIHTCPYSIQIRLRLCYGFASVHAPVQFASFHFFSIAPEPHEMCTLKLSRYVHFVLMCFCRGVCRLLRFIYFSCSRFSFIATRSCILKSQTITYLYDCFFLYQQSSD